MVINNAMIIGINANLLNFVLILVELFNSLFSIYNVDEFSGLVSNSLLPKWLFNNSTTNGTGRYYSFGLIKLSFALNIAFTYIL